MQKTLVTAVIPTRNRPELLKRAIVSVRAQTYDQIEIVVVIDGPDDATRAVLSEMCDERLRFIPLQESVGGSDARNIGVQNARSEWIAFLDDDDEWLPSKIEKQMALAALGQRTVSGDFLTADCQESLRRLYLAAKISGGIRAHQRISVQSKNLLSGRGAAANFHAPDAAIAFGAGAFYQRAPQASGSRMVFARLSGAGRAIPFRSRTAGELVPRGKSRRDHQPSGLAVFPRLAQSQSRTDDSPGVCWIRFHALGAGSLAARRLAGGAATFCGNVSPRKAGIYGSFALSGDVADSTVLSPHASSVAAFERQKQPV